MSAAYVAFLRAINLGRVRRLPMSDVTRVLGAAGYTDLATYLATGNVRLTGARGRDTDEVAEEVRTLLSDHAGFDVPVVLCTLGELSAVREEARSLDGVAAGESTKRYVAFLPAPPGDAARDELATWSEAHPGEAAYVGDRHLHWWTTGATTDVDIFKPAALRRLGIPEATSRTVKVVDTLVGRWC